MPAPSSIKPSDLLAVLGRADAPAIVDVCIAEDFAADPYLIPGSFRHPHSDLERLVERLDGGPAVIVCQKGRKLSEGVAAWLRSDGIDAKILEGGMLGWRNTASAPRVRAAALPPCVDDRTLWVTQRSPGPADLAKLWLVRRFIDRRARILFVSQSEIADVSDRFTASTLDGFTTGLADPATGGSFYDMLTHFELNYPPLTRLAAMLKYDTSRSGLNDILAGMALCEATDEHLLETALLVFDALFAREAHR